METNFFCLASLSVVMVFLQCNAEIGEICSPSSCGSVENDSKKFYVDTISYDQGKLRIVDSGLERDICSSLPRYFLDPDHDQGDGFYPFYLQPEIEEITYVNCSAPMESPSYIATAPCFNSSSLPFLYAIIGNNLTVFRNDNCIIISSANLAAEKTQNLMGPISFM